MLRSKSCYRFRLGCCLDKTQSKGEKLERRIEKTITWVRLSAGRRRCRLAHLRTVVLSHCTI